MRPNVTATRVPQHKDYYLERLPTNMRELLRANTKLGIKACTLRRLWRLILRQQMLDAIYTRPISTREAFYKSIGMVADRETNFGASTLANSRFGLREKYLALKSSGVSR